MGSADAQGALWGASARDWADLAEPHQIPFYEAAFEVLGVAGGMRLLDAGCGAGLALSLAAERGAIVTGLDASAGLLAVARERLPAADLRLGDLAALPYADASFDAVTAFNAVQYADDPTGGLREIRRVARPGAGVAVVTWGAPQRCEMRAVLDTIRSLLPPAPAGAVGPFALAAPGALEALVEGAGLPPERTIEVPAPYIDADVEVSVRAHLSSGPARRAIEHSGLAAVSDALRAVAEAARQPDGTVRFDNVFRVVIARA